MKDHGAWIVPLAIGVISGLYVLLRKSTAKRTLLSQNGGENSKNYQAMGDININTKKDDK